MNDVFPQKTMVQILGDGSKCLVQGEFVALAELGTHLKLVVGLEPGALVGMKSSPSTKLTFEAATSVANHLREAGFVLETWQFR